MPAKVVVTAPPPPIGAVPGFGVEAGGGSAGIGEVIYNSAVMLNLTEVLGLRGAM